MNAMRQPVHVVYGGAHLFKSDTTRKLGTLAERALAEYAPDATTLAYALGIPDDFSPVGVIPVGRALPDKRSESLKRGWVPNPEFARWDRW